MRRTGRIPYLITVPIPTTEESGYSSTRGYYVGIKINGYTIRFLHMKKGSILVKKGQKVYKGQRLGYMGNTGNSEGAHLHLSITNPSGKYINPLDIPGLPKNIHT